MGKEPKVYLKKLAIAAGEYNNITGNVMAIEPHTGDNKSEVILRIHMPNNVVCGIGYYSHQVALGVIKALCHYDGALTTSINGGTHTAERFIAPGVAQPVSPLFLVPKEPASPILSKEKYFRLMSKLDHGTLTHLLVLFKDSVSHLMVNTSEFRVDEIMASDVNAAKSYIYVFETHGVWSNPKAATNVRVLLKRYRQYVMEAVNKEYLEGRPVFDPKYKVPIA